jgi:hypothetical protein
VGPFSLFAFVICPPDEAEGVRGVMEKHFSYLDVATADRLLFYAPVDEPPRWRQQRTGREASHALLKFHDFINYSCRSKDPPSTQHALAVTLGIELSDLPVLVLTTDPRRNEFVVLRTCADHVRRQLLALGELAQDIPPLQDRAGAAAYRLDAADLRRRGLDLCEGVYSPEMVESLADALHQVLSVALTREGDWGHRHYAASSAHALLAGLGDRIQRARGAVRVAGGPGEPALAEGEEDQTLRLLERLACYLPLLAERGPAATPDVPAGWDAQSKRWVRLGDQVEGVLGGLPHPSLDPDHHVGQARLVERGADGQQPPGPPADFSPAAVCWAKAFEAELQHSLGHWVRGLLGVELPRFFGKVQDGVSAVFASSGGEFRLDFNRRRRPGQDEWKPPELGPLQGPVRYYLKRRPPPPLDEAGQRKLFDGWESVRLVRNDACHAQVVPRDRAVVVRRVIRELEGAAVLRDLARLKARLRGDPAPPEGGPPGQATPPRARAKRWWQFWR